MPVTNALLTVYRVLHVVAFYLLAAVALAAIGFTAASAIGWAPWLSLSVTLGDVSYPAAGPIVQFGLTLLLAALFFFMPAASRMMTLESSHRDFKISMEDVARAYYAAHAGDRAGMFTMSSEFDQVRERIAFLREHPDLARLEPEVMEVAAQMSQQARELADVYSVEKVERAKTFLRQRQEEAETQQTRIVEALHVSQELRSWAQQVELEESMVAAQIDRLSEQLQEILPDLGMQLGRAGHSSNVVSIENKPAAE